jgi:membrane fusion protein, multidrug efflux system
MKLSHVVIAVSVSAVLGVSGWFYYTYSVDYPSTPDAYIDRNVAHIAAQVNGPVSQVYVASHQRVKAGDILFSIDPAPFRLAVDNAKAQLQQAREQYAAEQADVAAAQAKVAASRATLQETEKHAARVLDLVNQGTASKDRGDEVKRKLKNAGDQLAASVAELKSARARLGAEGDGNAAIKAAEAALAQAKLDLEHTRIAAPTDGVVGDVALRPGTYVSVGVAQFPLVESQGVWVNANFKESDMVRIRPGQPAQINVDMQPGKTFNGRVISLSPASGTSFSLLPPENATGNWVKITQRFPVRIRVLNADSGLRLGASSEVTVNTTGLQE